MSSVNARLFHDSGLNAEQVAYIARLSRERLTAVQIAAKTGLHPDRVVLALSPEGTSRTAAEQGDRS